ncbi:BAF_collapsed_G0029980.mRNA.1.CDS.1 [Saccharomyces cerevisiae]|nr:Ist1p [Saccharomyces cerevisiae YJM1418]CAI4692089.1 CFA_G0044290.mRNA.1.CDS.1 [Saccharomyces cerevisiae]CAI4699662.1 CCQ_1a_G0043910.mRNA.1.CDS.1 [Saccharomyces cerevisiae]CAI4700564.1 BAK_1a_G0043900.mRNA.1.CDS.1 [Saccharomyces cerevisiae]CAI4712721.1 BAI_1a_G0043960.mRNA.1.CDS.1 [Saccharomyces cerevisiae]
MAPSMIPFTIKLKTCLKMCIQRLRYAQEKQQAIAKQSRRQVAQLLLTNKEQKAHYRVETLIHDDIHIELLEILELYCELLLARVQVINDISTEEQLVKEHMDDGINEAIRSLIYAILFVDEVKELSQLKDLMAWKINVEFVNGVIADHIDVPEKIIKKCSPSVPKEELVDLYLKEIAKTYDVPYSKLENSLSSSSSSISSDFSDPSGDIEDNDEEKPILALDNDDNDNADAKHPITVKKPRQNSENIKNELKIPKDIKKEVIEKKQSEKKTTKRKTKKEQENDELDELKKRFDALRRK